MTWALEALGLSLDADAEHSTSADYPAGPTSALETTDTLAHPLGSRFHDPADSVSWSSAARSVQLELPNAADSGQIREGRRLHAADSAGLLHTSAAELQQKSGSLAGELEQLRLELRRQHELTDTAGYQEHPLGEPLKLRSQFWQIEIDTTTGWSSATALCKLALPFG